jgi:uncharacterized protein
MSKSLSIESTIPIPANCFNPRSYVKSTPATGMLATRYGDRLIAVPEVLLRSIPKTLREEAGEASYLALYTFGDNWGKSFCRRMVQEIVQYYRKPVLDMFSADFLVYIQESWAVHGLGKPTIDFSFADRGLLVVTITNSGIGGNAPLALDSNYRSFSLEAGFLAGWFSTLTDNNLRACASNWDKAPDEIQFLVGGATHIESIERTNLKHGCLTPKQIQNLL